MRRLSAFVAAILAVCVPAAAEPMRLRIASEGARPPFNFLDAGNQLAGFEIDLSREICRRIEADCAFVAQDWESLIPGLEAKQYDVIVAAMEITEERQRRIAFSKPYARTPSTLIAQKQSELRSAEPGALEGLRIAVEADGAQQSYLEDKFPKVEIARYATLEEAMLDLAEGRVDAVAEDKLTAFDFLKSRKEGRCCRMVADLPQDPDYFGAGYGFGLRKEEAALQSAIDAALDATVEDGTFDAIRGRYFEFDIR